MWIREWSINGFVGNKWLVTGDRGSEIRVFKRYQWNEEGYTLCGNMEGLRDIRGLRGLSESKFMISTNFMIPSLITEFLRIIFNLTRSMDIKSPIYLYNSCYIEIPQYHSRSPLIHAYSQKTPNPQIFNHHDRIISVFSAAGKNFKNSGRSLSQKLSFLAPQAKILRIWEGQEGRFLSFSAPQAKILRIWEGQEARFLPFIVREISKNCVKIA